MKVILMRWDELVAQQYLSAPHTSGGQVDIGMANASNAISENNEHKGELTERERVYCVELWGNLPIDSK